MLSNRVRQDGESGAVAIITALVVVFVLLPVAALGVANYSRSAVTAEVQRAGDSGALAGAAGLNLLDLGTLPQASLINNLGLPVKDASKTLQQACLATQKAFGIANPAIPAAGQSIPQQDGNANSPVSRAFGNLTRCSAKYAPDPTLAGCVQDVTDAVNLVLGAPINRVTGVLNGLPIVGPLLSPLQLDLNTVTSSVTNLVPALVHNGVIVDLEYTVQGPLDALLGADGPTALTTRSTARRLFKPLLPLGLQRTLAGGTLGALTNRLDLTNGLSGLTLAADGLVVVPLEQFAVAQLQLALTTLKLLVNGTTGPLSAQALQPLLSTTDTLLKGLIDDLVSPLLAPLLNPLLGGTIAAPSLTKVLESNCRQAIVDLIDDLSGALTINQDPQDQGLLPCLTEQVLGLRADLTRTLVTTQDCTNRVFRSTIGPNPSTAKIPFGP